MKRVLTGITTTGTPHLGNYVGAIRPAIRASEQAGVESFFFMADYHALIKCEDPARIERSRLEIAATWLACGLDAERVVFYRQSDIPEIPELTWLLTCVTAKGLMNRAHAYKAAVDANLAEQLDPDAGINMGLYSYPILMAADILMFNASHVPVGRDQVQHIEMARDIGQRFNHVFGKRPYGAGGYGEGNYGGGYSEHEFFVLPEAVIDESVATLPGLDGRKMSKSYDNTIPLFEGGARRTEEAIARIVTDSRLPGEPKDAEGTTLFTLFQAFAGAEESAAFAAALRDGMAWGEAKKALAARIEQEVGPMRALYAELMAHPERIEQTLQHGATRARAVARPLLDTLRAAVGLRPMRALGDAATRTTAKVAPSKPQHKQFRDTDGLFYFKLTAADGTLLLESSGFANPREAAACFSALKQNPAQLSAADTRYRISADVTAAAEALAALSES